MSPSYRHFAPVSMSSRAGRMLEDSLMSASMREKNLLARLQLSSPGAPSHQPGLGEQLNQSAIGTHV